MFPAQPTSRKWVEENNHPSENHVNNTFFKTCCVVNCKSKASIRNYRSLQGDWVKKEGCNHTKICIYHYNADLKQYPRSRKRKRTQITPSLGKFQQNDSDFVITPTQIAYEEKIEQQEERTIAQSRGRRRKKRRKTIKHDFFVTLDEDQCCIKGCREIASIRNYSSLVGTWEVKEAHLKRPKLKICNSHYLTDLKSNPRKKKRKKKKIGREGGEMLTVLLVASFFV